MHLNEKQSKKFYRLFNSLLAYANEIFDISDELSGLSISRPSTEDLWDLSNELMDNRAVIDSYVDENFYGFSPKDLEIVSSWKHALSSTFILHHHTREHSVFIDGTYAFEVSGITHSIEEIVPNVPTMVKTILLPFEDKIIYATNIVSFPLDLGEDISEILKGSYDEVLSKGSVVRTAREFIEVSDVIREQKALDSIDELIEDLEYESAGETRQHEGIHRGVLADVAFEDREKVIIEELFDNIPGLRPWDTESLSAIAQKRKPSDTIEVILTRKTKTELLEIASFFYLKGASKLKKQDLIDALLPLYLDPADILEDYLIQVSTAAFEGFEKLYKSGGILSFSFDEEIDKGLSTLAYRSFPIELFEFEQKFTFVIPHELRGAIGRIDLPSIKLQKEEINLLVRYASILTDLRGVVAMDVVYRLYRDHFPQGMEYDAFEDIIVSQCLYSDVDYDISYRDGNLYLIHFLISTAYHKGFSEEYKNDGFIEYLESYRGNIIERQKLLPERVPTKDDMKDRLFVDGLTYNTPQTKAFIQFLDAHIPDDENDYSFADRMLEELAEMHRLGQPIKDMCEVLFMNGLEFDLPTTNQMLKLLSDMVNHWPTWLNGGWTPFDVIEQETGKKFFYDEDGKPLDVGRNDPCPCGSGKKYKKCCGSGNV